MALAIYKKGQGYWTRLMSAIAFATIALMGAVWVWKLLTGARWFGIQQPVYIQAGASVVVLGICGWLIFFFVGRQRGAVDFMIATEGEMKKVNWSSRREIMGSTWVVIGLTVFIAALCFAADRLFQYVFTLARVLET